MQVATRSATLLWCFFGPERMLSSFTRGVFTHLRLKHPIEYALFVYNACVCEQNL